MENNDRNDYGNEDFDPNAEAKNDGDDGNNGDGNNAGGEENVDQYFDDAGDIGYLPADHVRFPFVVSNRRFNSP
jgi:hypothetical protein